MYHAIAYTLLCKLNYGYQESGTKDADSQQQLQ